MSIDLGLEFMECLFEIIFLWLQMRQLNSKFYRLVINICFWYLIYSQLDQD